MGRCIARRDSIDEQSFSFRILEFKGCVVLQADSWLQTKGLDPYYGLFESRCNVLISGAHSLMRREKFSPISFCRIFPFQLPHRHIVQCYKTRNCNTLSSICSMCICMCTI